jgi:hypothetical protein
MFAIDHAATALVIKRWFPDAPLPQLLLSVQLMVTHDHDLAWAPGLGGHLGLGLYGTAPMAAFVVELAYGLLCWWIFRGGRALLAVIVGFNLANLTFFSAALPGPEALLANRPTAVVLVVLAQIIATLFLVGRFGRPRPGRAQ